MRILALLPALLLIGQSDPLDEYRKASFAQKKGKFDDACKTRIALEFEIIRKGDTAGLRKALTDSNRDVRAFAAEALGILKDKKAGPAIAKMATEDSDALVRGMAVQSLGWLRTGQKAIQAAKNDRSRDVKFLADVAEAHLSDRTDHAKIVLDAYKKGIKKEEMNSAAVGKAAPDFEILSLNGKPFKLSSVLKKKKVVVLMFQLADW